MLHVHAQTFSATKVSLQDSFSCRIIPSLAVYAANCDMAHDPETPAEKAAHRKRMLDDQKAMLQHVPAWLRYRGMTQREASEALFVKEA